MIVAKNCLDIIELNRTKKEPILYFYENFKMTQALTYQDIWLGSQLYAHRLLQQNLVTNQVILSLPNSPEFIFAFFGTLMAGLTPVPVATREHLSEAEYLELIEGIAQRAQASLIIFDPISATAARKMAGLAHLQAPIKTSVEKSSLQQVSRFLDANDVCFIQFSSGSTAEPKGVLLSHANLLANLEQIRKGMKVTGKDILISWLPFYHDMGWIGAVLGPLFNQVPAHLMSPLDFVRSTEGFVELVAKVKATILLGPNFMYRSMVYKVSAEKVSKLDLSSIRLALTGAEPVSAETNRRLQNHYYLGGFRPEAIFPVYGLAEASLGVAFNPVGRRFRHLVVDLQEFEAGRIRVTEKKSNAVEFVSCGSALPNVQIQILNEANEVLKENEIGEVLILSPSMTSGYFGLEKETQDLFHEGFLRTGDLGFLHDKELYIVGRKKDVIIRHGRKIHAIDIERKVAALKSSQMGRMAAVGVFSTETGSEDVHLVIETKHWNGRARVRMKEAIVMALNGKAPLLAEHIHFVPPCILPRTSSGKIRRREVSRMIRTGYLKGKEKWFFSYLLRSRFLNLGILFRSEYYRMRSSFGWNLFRSKKGNAVLQDPLLEKLSKIFAESLAIPVTQVDPCRHFSEFKMDSVKVVELNEKVSAQFGEIPLHDFIQFSSLIEVRHYLSQSFRLAPKEGPYIQEPGRREEHESSDRVESI